MNIIIISLSLIGLLNFSSAAHDVLHEKKHLEHLKKHHQTRDHTTEATPLKINETLKNYDGLNLLHNCDMKMIGFANVTENVAYIAKKTDSGPITILIDSKSGEILTFTDCSEITFITDNPDAKGDILEVVSKLLDKHIFKNESIPGNSTKVKPDNEQALGILDEVYLHLGHPKDENPKKLRSFKTIDSITKTLDHQLDGSLRGIINGNDPHPLKQNLNRFLTILSGLEKLFSQASGGLKSILDQGLKFDIDPLFNNKNGAAVFTYILRVTSQKFDLSKLFSNLWMNWDQLFRIIQMLGGGESKNGVDETFSLVLHIWETLNFQLSISDLVKFLTAASCEDQWSEADDGDYKEVIKDLKDITDQQSKKFDGSGKMNPFTTFFSNFTGNTLIQHDVNISDIVMKWHKRDIVGGFQWVLDTSLSIFNPKLYTDVFFNTYTAFLNSTSDPSALKRLVPGVSIDQFTKNASLLENINKLYDVDKKLKNGKDPNSIFKEIPAFDEFSKTCSKALGNGMDYSKLLKGGSISDYLNGGSGMMSNSVKWSVDSVKNFFGDSEKMMEKIFVDPFKGMMGGFGGDKSGETVTLPGSSTVSKDDDGNDAAVVTSSTTPSTTTTEAPCETTTTPPKSKRNHHHMKHHMNTNIHHENKLKKKSHNVKKHDLETKHHHVRNLHQHGQKMEKKHHQN